MRKMTMTRKILLGVFATGAIAGTLVYPHSAAAIGLKENSVVTNSTITLGDIFTGLTKDADKVMGVSPQPGHEMVLDSRTLLRIAMALDLPWRPETAADTVVLRRAASLVSNDQIDAALHSSMTDKGVTGDYKLELSSEVEQMVLPQNMEPTVEVSNLNVKADQNWFSATLAAPSKDNPMVTRRVSGRIEYMAKVPVLRENLEIGSIIGANDIDYIEMPQRSLKSSIVLSADTLIGMTPRRVLVAGSPLNSMDIQSPQMVKRGDMVTMIFSRGGLQLTAQGKALENGAKGDHVRVVNASSNKTVVAEVSSDKEVTVSTF